MKVIEMPGWVLLITLISWFLWSLWKCLDILISTRYARHYRYLDVGRNTPGGTSKAIQARSARWRFRRIWEAFAGNTGSRYRSNRLIPAYILSYLVPTRRVGMQCRTRCVRYFASSQAPAWELAQFRLLALLDR